MAFTKVIIILDIKKYSFSPIHNKAISYFYFIHILLNLCPRGFGYYPPFAAPVLNKSLASVIL